MELEHSVIIGASSGVGRGIAERFSDSMKVSVFARREAELSELVSDRETMAAYSVDATDIDAFKLNLQNAVERFGVVDRFIYCAGVQVMRPHRTLSPLDIQQMLDINFVAAALHAKIFLSNKISAPNAVFCAISSIAAVSPEPAIVTYGATKAALNTLVAGLAREAAPRRFVGVAPGWMETEMTQRQPLYGEQFKADLEKRSPLGITSVDDVVHAVEFLTGPSGSAITGQILVVDSGMSI